MTATLGLFQLLTPEQQFDALDFEGDNQPIGDKMDKPTEVTITLAHYEELELQAGVTRICVVCGAKKLASLPIDSLHKSCDGVACTWDLTPQEAVEFWKSKFYSVSNVITKALDNTKNPRVETPYDYDWYR